LLAIEAASCACLRQRGSNLRELCFANEEHDRPKTNDEIYRLKRNAVLRESCRIISKRGFHNTSLDDVARALNVSKGTLYNYVKDKQEIMFEYHKMALHIGDRAFELAEAGASTAGEALRLILDELGACGVITEIDALKSADRKIIVARRDKLEAGFIKLLRQGADDGSLR
jgi:AcrR family transcriptional regulator